MQIASRKMKERNTSSVEARGQYGERASHIYLKFSSSSMTEPMVNNSTGNQGVSGVGQQQQGKGFEVSLYIGQAQEQPFSS